jgi:hypothetical protein
VSAEVLQPNGRSAVPALMNSKSDLIAEAIAGACAAVAVAVVLDKSEVVKRAAGKVPRLGWRSEDTESPPLLARLLGTIVASIVFRSTFSVTRNAAQQVV